MSTATSHATTVKPYLASRSGDRLTYRPRCSCGWIGQRYGNRTNAEQEAAAHAVSAVLSVGEALPGTTTLGEAKSG